MNSEDEIRRNKMKRLKLREKQYKQEFEDKTKEIEEYKQSTF